VSRERILITCRQMQTCIETFRPEFARHNLELTLTDVVQHPTEEELISIIGGFDGMIAGDDPLTSRVLDHADRLRVISKWGVGLDGIDLEAAEHRDITVTNTPGAFGDEVADVAAGYIVMLARQLHRIDASVRAGGWLKAEGQTLREKVVGIVGFGSIGQSVATRCLAFGMNVIATDIAHTAQMPAGAPPVELLMRDELFRRSDYVVLCSPLTPATRHIANASTIGLMRRGGFIVNVARGGLIDEAALCAALGSGQLAAAALDVYEDEPLSATNPIRAFDRCVFGSHNGSNTREAVMRASAQAVDNLLHGLALL